MKKGFAANYIINADNVIKCAVIFIENNIFSEIKNLDSEYPLTRFYDGALLLTAYDSLSFENIKEFKSGDKIDIWQVLNYSKELNPKDYKLKKVSDI